MTCNWCYSGAVWQAHTVRHGAVSVCQRHYDELVAERKAGALRGLSGEALAIVRDFHNWKG
jgi:hypothetical protein